MAIFNVPIFFVIMREAIEASLIISVMLSFITKIGIQEKLHARRLKRQVIFGTIIGFVLTAIIGGVLIYLFYRFSQNIWKNHEDLWEGIFSLISSIVLGIVGYYFMQLQTLVHKIQLKLSKNMAETSNNAGGGYSFLVLSFLTIIREGVEAILLISGVAISATAKSIPLSVICGVAVGIFFGFLIFYFGKRMSVYAFIVASTVLLYLMGSAMFSNSIKFLESYVFGRETSIDADTGYIFQINKSVWMLNCCNPNDPGNGGYQIFQALLGWTNNATIGTILGYISYWAVVSIFYIYKGILLKREIVKKSNPLRITTALNE
ncbi:hypothetical protein BB559_004748 [Furculomyces boomerangus]|uniref:Iron permease FTR1 n=2 Tax=Harpellales TaxID=61421 RepID=A0A2T9YCW6_9FUNG|nr:hypothetical protein BB559_004748 [Furculomyces boomerangus]PVZ99239.1 hypothetical protein BB558_004737 [Smittium angustum]